ncbi:MAG: class I SAM-dependent methyltransferase [Bacteroidota bacterium]
MTADQAFSLINNHRLTTIQRPTHWADLGCGSGLFTLALSRLLQPGSSIHGIDIHPSLKRQTTTNGVELLSLKLDFVTNDWGLRDLDGILMANSLHYVKDKTTFLKKISPYLLPAVSFLIVEYDTDTPVPTWVPYPLSFSSLTALFTQAGYRSIQKIGQRPSAYGRANMYAALIQSR